MEQYYRPVVGDDGTFDTTRFSGFVELQKPGIKQAITATGFTLTDFAKWIHDNTLYPLQKVRLLPRILRNEKGSGSLSQARRSQSGEGARQAGFDPNTPRRWAQPTRKRTRIPVSRRFPYSEYQRIKNDITGDTAQALLEAQAGAYESDQQSRLNILTMPESSTHVALVQSIVQFAIREFGALADIAVREDAVRPIRHEKPPRIDRYVPDVFVTDVPTTRTLIGEAKTLKDIETDHTRRQVSTFLTYLCRRPLAVSSFSASHFKGARRLSAFSENSVDNSLVRATPYGGARSIHYASLADMRC